MQAFMNAVTLNKIKTVRELLPKIKFTPQFNEAIKISAEKGFLKLTKLLLEDSRFDPSVDNNYALRMSLANGHQKVAELLLRDPRVDAQSNDNYAVKKSINDGYTGVIKILLEDERINFGVHNSMFLAKAVWRGHVEIVKLLLNDCQVDPAANDNYIIKNHCSNVEIVKLLYDDGRVDFTAEHNRPIFSAVDSNYLETAKFLLTIPEVNPSDENSDEESCLKQAFMMNNIEMVKLLLTDPRVDPTELDDDSYYYGLDGSESGNDSDYEDTRDQDHEIVLKLIKKDKKKYPNFLIRQNNVRLENDILKIQAVLKECQEQVTFYEGVYANTFKNPNGKNTKVEEIATVMIQMLEPEIFKLTQEIKNLKQEQEKFKQENS